MAFVHKMDGTPTGPTYDYSTLAALQQAADRGDASAAILLAEMSEPEQRLARGLVETFTAKAGGLMPGKTAKRAKREMKSKAAITPKPPKQSMRAMWEADRYSPDPVRRLTAERALRAL
jgi:hypothetical protein